MKKRKIGIILILIGISIPSVIYFFTNDDQEISFSESKGKTITRRLTQNELKALSRKKEYYRNFINEYKKLKDEDLSFALNTPVINTVNDDDITISWNIYTFSGGGFSIPYRYFVGIGLAIIFIGIGLFIFSFFPKEEKSKI